MEISEEMVFQELLKISEMRDEKNFVDCKKAMHLAEKLNVPTGMIGKVCNQNGIKIQHCQLGCF